jgi:hypothetical protein
VFLHQPSGKLGQATAGEHALQHRPAIVERMAQNRVRASNFISRCMQVNVDAEPVHPQCVSNLARIRHPSVQHP